MTKQVAPARYHRRLEHWYTSHRRDLPWRHTRDPYAIAVSEVMLQQTQVDRVMPKYLLWLKTFPTTKKLAQAPLSRVLKLWSGLGYNRRAKMLREAARVVLKEYHGVWPSEVGELQKLPGFGPYTAGAVAVFAYQQPVTMIDTNVRRVLTRWRVGTNTVGTKRMQMIANEMLPAAKPDEWHHALMDFGATVCQSRPHCTACPFRDVCAAYPAILQKPQIRKVKKPRFVETNRFVRGRIMAIMLEHSMMPVKTLATKLQHEHGIDIARFTPALRGLVVEKLLQIRGSRVRVSR